MKKKDFLIGPFLFAAFVSVLLLIGAMFDPAWVVRNFDAGGYSPFELITIPFYAVLVPLVWWKCPFAGPRWRQVVLCSAVSCVALMAVVKELDLHALAMHGMFPDIVDADGKVFGLVRPDGKPLTGTAFKMRFLTNEAVPGLAKACVVFYFGAFFGVFAVVLGYFFPRFVKGVFTLNPVAWYVGCLGGTGVMVQLCDRMPAWYRHLTSMPKPKEGMVDSAQALFTVLEEGGEMLIAIFAILAILKSHELLKKSRVI